MFKRIFINYVLNNKYYISPRGQVATRTLDCGLW